MNDDDPSSELRHVQPASVQKPDPSTTERPEWALTELTRANPSPIPPNHNDEGLAGIEWVRPTDLAQRASADIMARTAGAHKDTHTWARTRLREAIIPSERARHLAPLSAFGYNGPAPAKRRDGLSR
jgi:hypothetical protein